MPVTDSYMQYINDQLSAFGSVEMKKMFGGIGIFKDGIMFGMLANDLLRFKVDATNQADYESYGMKAFYNEKKGKGMPYWEVPLNVIEDHELLSQWATMSYEAGLRSKK